MKKVPVFVKDKLAAVNANLFVKPTQTLVLDGDAAANEITIHYTGLNGTDKTVAYNQAATPAALVLKAAVPAWTPPGPVFVTLTKGTTTNNLGVLLVGN